MGCVTNKISKHYINIIFYETTHLLQLKLLDLQTIIHDKIFNRIYDISKTTDLNECTFCVVLSQYIIKIMKTISDKLIFIESILNTIITNTNKFIILYYEFISIIKCLKNILVTFYKFYKKCNISSIKDIIKDGLYRLSDYNLNVYNGFVIIPGAIYSI